MLKEKPGEINKEKVYLQKYFSLMGFKKGEDIKQLLKDLLEIAGDKSILFNFDETSKHAELIYFLLESDQEYTDRMNDHQRRVDEYNKWVENNKEDIEYTLVEQEKERQARNEIGLRQLKLDKSLLLRDLAIIEEAIKLEKEKIDAESDKD